MRADAVRNRGRVLEAAVEAFAEHGELAQMEDIARRAGVGIGTIYRHFPTKEALAHAIQDQRFTEVLGFVRSRLREDDPWDILVAVLENAGRMHASDRGLTEVVVAAGAGAPAGSVAVELDAAMDEILARARAARVVRSDLTTADMHGVFCGLAAVAGAGGEWRRYLDIVLDGLRPR